MDAATRPRMFLCDDNVALRAAIRDLLADAGVEVVGEAGDGIGALRGVPSTTHPAPVVVLMDLRMPGRINGIETTRLLVGRCADVRVIIFTAFPGEGVAQAARQAGAVAALVKGVSAETLEAEIRRAWSAATEGYGWRRVSGWSRRSRRPSG